MATYFFETITDAQAASYDADSDTLVFQTPGERATITTVRFNPETATSPPTISLISGLTGRTVTFGDGMIGEGLGASDPGIIFPDGSQLFVGTPGADNFGSPRDTSDGYYGSDGGDQFFGGGGDDFGQGNQGGDTIQAGAGSDTSYGGRDDDLIDTGNDIEGTTNFAQGNLGNDSLTSGGALSITTLLGGQGTDTVQRGWLGDVLNG